MNSAVFPPRWRRMATRHLERMVDDGEVPDEFFDDVLEELDDRWRQDDANRGAMNGLAPEV